MELQGPGFMSVSSFACAKRRFYHGGDFFTLNDIPLGDTCGTVGRLDTARVNSVIDKLYVSRGRVS